MAEKPSNESLVKLLNALSSRKEVSNDAYTELRGTLVRFFQIKGDTEPDQAADETLDRVSIKISQNTKIDNLTKYSFGVARFVFLERLKRSEKERIAAEGFYQNKRFYEGDKETDDFALQRECLKKLSDEDKQFLQDYFADLPYEQLIKHRENLTVKLNLSFSNLRLKIFRLRRRLDNCVKNKLK